jgi:hypothetical protein
LKDTAGNQLSIASDTLKKIALRLIDQLHETGNH